MFYRYRDELGGGWVYWCTATGEIHRNGDFDCKYEDMPMALRSAYDKLWTDMYDVSCYVVQFQGKCGIALGAEYDRDFAQSLGVSYERLMETVEEKAHGFGKLWPWLDVVFGADTLRWNDGETASELFVILPWFTDRWEFDKVARRFGRECYEGLA